MRRTQSVVDKIRFSALNRCSTSKNGQVMKITQTLFLHNISSRIGHLELFPGQHRLTESGTGKQHWSSGCDACDRAIETPPHYCSLCQASPALQAKVSTIPSYKTTIEFIILWFGRVCVWFCGHSPCMMLPCGSPVFHEVESTKTPHVAQLAAGRCLRSVILCKGTQRNRRKDPTTILEHRHVGGDSGEIFRRSSAVTAAQRKHCTGRAL